MCIFEMLLPKLVPGLFPVVRKECQQGSGSGPPGEGMLTSEIPSHSGDSCLWDNGRYMPGMTRTPRSFSSSGLLVPALAARVL